MAVRSLCCLGRFFLSLCVCVLVCLGVPLPCTPPHRSFPPDRCLQGWTIAACVCGGLALVSGLLDVSAVLRMFVPWNTLRAPTLVPASPKKGVDATAAAAPTVRWEVFRFFNWITSITFLFCVAHLASVQRRGLSVLFHSKAVIAYCAW